MGVERDDIDLAAHVADQFIEPPRVVVAVVDIGEQDILEGNPLAAVQGHLSHGLEELGDVPAGVDRHDPVTHAVGCCVEADR